MQRDDVLEARVNDASATGAARLEALRALAQGLGPAPPGGGESNNHVHTIYSFSPYTPAMAALRCRDAGLEVAGSVDHDSIAAADEMREACAVLGLGSVTGCEVRVSFKDGKHADRKINNPDSAGIVYMTMQGLPPQGVPVVEAFLAPIRARRRERTRRMCDAASTVLAEAGLAPLDFRHDVEDRSKAREGGGLTERHLLAAVARRLIEAFGSGAPLVEALRTRLRVTAPPRVAALLREADNPYLLYDLLGLLKSTFLDRVFIQPDSVECPPARTAVSVALAAGAIPAYAYLGDVGESPTGDKKAEKFEDDFLDELFVELVEMGFPAITYMPPRNSAAQLERLRLLCARHRLMEVSGVDINQPRQSFNCPELRLPEFRHLVDSTWALVAHERFSSINPRMGIFSAGGPLASLSPEERIAAYARAGRSFDLHRPQTAAEAMTALEKGKFTR